MFYKGEIPFVRLIVPLILGILSGYYFASERLFNSAPIFAFICFLILGILIFNYKRLSIYRVKWIVGLISHFIIAATGYWLTVYSSEKYDKSHYSLQKADAFVVKIKSEPRMSNYVSRFEASVVASYFQGRKDNATGKIIVSIQADSINTLDLKYGDLLLIPSKFDSIDPPYNPGEFNYKAYLGDRQFYHQAFLPQNQFYLVNRDEGNPCISFALSLRKRLVDKFYKYLPDKNAAAFASTLILGYRAELSRELIEAYSKTGTMHVLSVSGMHVGIVFMVLSVVLKFMDKTKGTRLIRAILIISIIWFYALLTGFSAPACRAAVMLSFIVLGKALNKHQNTYNLIAISAFLLLIYNPFYIVDAGFQLSYLAVVGLVYFHPKIYQTIYVKNKLLDHMWSYSALSIAAQIATFPFSIYYFHQFPVYFLFSNLLIVLPVAVIMYSGILLMFIPDSLILHYAGKILSILINSTNEILYYIENLPFSSWGGIWINTMQCVLICLLIILASFRLAFSYRRFNLPIVVLTIFLCSNLSWTWLRNEKQHQIIFYNLKKKTGIAYLSQGKSIIVSDVDQSDKLVHFSLLPAVKMKGSQSELFYNPRETFSEDSYAADRNFYQFGSCRIFRWDKSFDNTEFTKALAVDVVLISGNPRTSIRQIAACLSFKRIIIDANNPDYKIDRWVVEAKGMGYKYYVLKKSPALIVNL
ncbi:ComEC/Rec2 family competence protein [Daejeonella sp.]|uniref:ComEC/Rec2 family competence protein n=1 Tax=Daejeonella sp. TaxID=2805397 RepID=UPI0030C44680